MGKQTAPAPVAAPAEATKDIKIGRMVLAHVSTEGTVDKHTVEYHNQNIILTVDQATGTKQFLLHDTVLSEFSGDLVKPFEVAKRLAYNLTYTAKQATDAGVDPSVYAGYISSWNAVTNAKKNWDRMAAKDAGVVAEPAPVAAAPVTPAPLPEVPSVPEPATEAPAEPEAVAPPIQHVNPEEQLGTVEVPLDQE
jgi:hypothetical protein